MRLTILSILRWEQLTGKPFARLDLADTADQDALLYATEGIPRGIPRDRFLASVASPRLRRKLLRGLADEIAVSASLMPGGGAEAGAEEGGQPQSLSSVVPLLLMSGVDARHLLHEALLPDLRLYLRAFGDLRRHAQEDARFWTYVSLLPHCARGTLDGGPSALVRFPWEEEGAAGPQGITEEEMRLAEKFFSMDN